MHGLLITQLPGLVVAVLSLIFAIKSLRFANAELARQERINTLFREGRPLDDPELLELLTRHYPQPMRVAHQLWKNLWGLIATGTALAGIVYLVYQMVLLWA